MIAIYLCSLIALVVICVVLSRYSENYMAPGSTLAGFLVIVMGGLVGFACVAGITLSFDWMAAGAKAEIINREYGTNYTQRKIFYASDVIETIREIKRSRIEINGDLFREEPDRSKETR